MKGFIVLDTCIPKKRGVCCITKVLFVIWLKEHFALEQAAGQSIDPAAVGTNLEWGS